MSSVWNTVLLVDASLSFYVKFFCLYNYAWKTSQSEWVATKGTTPKFAWNKRDTNLRKTSESGFGSIFCWYVRYKYKLHQISYCRNSFGLSGYTFKIYGKWYDSLKVLNIFCLEWLHWQKRPWNFGRRQKQTKNQSWHAGSQNLEKLRKIIAVLHSSIIR